MSSVNSPEAGAWVPGTAISAGKKEAGRGVPAAHAGALLPFHPTSRGVSKNERGSCLLYLQPPRESCWRIDYLGGHGEGFGSSRVALGPLGLRQTQGVQVGCLAEVGMETAAFEASAIECGMWVVTKLRRVINA